MFPRWTEDAGSKPQGDFWHLIQPFKVQPTTGFKMIPIARVITQMSTEGSTAKSTTVAECGPVQPHLVQVSIIFRILSTKDPSSRTSHCAVLHQLPGSSHGSLERKAHD
ncbi:Synaptotagmin-6 [Manis pentadactyla]|nr:Synaptotagmin-6 [Manis pentadactyla]